MKGKILGVATSDQAGVITGEDGKRYPYVLSEWRGAAAPVVGQDVDFDTRPDGKASDIYAALSGRAIPGLPFDQTNLPPAATNALAIAKARPIVWTAVVALLASVLLTFISIASNLPGLSNDPDSALLTRNLTGDTAVLGLAGKVGAAQDLVEFIESSAAAAGAALDVDSVAFVTQIKNFSGFLNVLYLIYLTPILAAAVLYFELTGKPDKRVNLAFAASSVLSVAIVWFLQMRIDDAIKGVMAAMGQGQEAALVSGADFVGFGLGAWLILFSGLAAFAIHFNLVRLKAV
jgi:hypothetical protein